MKKIFLLALLALSAVSCKEDAISYASVEESVVDEKSKNLMVMSDSVGAPNANTQQKIIRTANLRFETEDLEETHSRIVSSLKKFGGIVQNDRQENEYQSISRTLEVRVPSQNFDGFMSDVSKGVAYFDEKEISSSDVTEEYIDTESRIKTKKALEARYLELLKKANKVSEMLEVEAKLSEIREEIESKQARLNYLKSQVAMSTLTITFYKTRPDNGGATVSYGSKIGNALKSGVNGLSDFFIGLLEMWPFILILVALIVFFRKRWRRRKKQ